MVMSGASMPSKKSPRAKRPIFIPLGTVQRVRTVEVEFDWFPGFAIEQHRRCIASFHENAKLLGITSRPLEVSTRSTEEIGRRLSAFNLQVEHSKLGIIPLESAFQSSKVFTDGGPYTDLATKDPKTTKRDPRIRNTSPLVRFQFGEQDFPIKPITAFYDWLYFRALSLLDYELLRNVCQRDGFTDIAFNPVRSLNCQARSIALFVSFVRDGHKEPWKLDFDDFTEAAGYVMSSKITSIQTSFS